MLYEYLAPIGLSVEAYAAASEATLRILARERADVSVHGSACADHMAIYDDSGVFTTYVDRINLHDVVAAAVAGEPIVTVDSPERELSRCR